MYLCVYMCVCMCVDKLRIHYKFLSNNIFKKRYPIDFITVKIHNNAKKNLAHPMAQKLSALSFKNS